MSWPLGVPLSFSYVLTGRVASFAHFRIKELADKEKDVDKKMGLRKVFRSLQGVGLERALYL